MAIQLLRVLTPVRIVAADVDDGKLEQAKALGADDIVNNRNADEAAEQIRKITGSAPLLPTILQPCSLPLNGHSTTGSALGGTVCDSDAAAYHRR